MEIRKRSASRAMHAPHGAAHAYLAVLVAVAAALVAFLPASTAFSGTSGLVAAYGFENGSGSIVSDTSGNGNDGLLVNGSWASSGAFGGALRLDGSGVGAMVNDAPSLHLKHEMTLEAWVKPSAVSEDWRDVLYKGDNNYLLEATSTSNGVPATGVGFNGDGLGQTYGTEPLASSTWAYLAATYDGSELRLYVDGDEVSSIPETATIRSSANPLEMGGDRSYGHLFTGLIDEVRIYDVARSVSDIRSDMTQPVVSGTPGDVEPPSAPSGLSAKAVSPGEVDLSWGAATDASSVIYDVQRCTGSGCTDFASLATAAATSYADTSTAADTTYSYRVRAVDAAGNTGPFSDTAEATTPPAADTEPPSAPSGLSAKAVSPGEVDLSWGAATDASSVIYDVQRCTGSGCTDFASLATAAATSYADTSTAADTTYSYRVRAVDAAGNTGPFSDTAEATTPPAADTEPPSAPSGLSAKAVSPGEVDLSWGAATDASSVIYDVQRCTGSGCTDFASLATAAATSYADTSTAADTTYSYRVRAVDAAGNTGPFSDTAEATTPPAADTEPPSAPSGLSAKAVSPGEVDLSWGAATDASSVIYDVQRCTGSGCTDFASLATAAATSYADTSTAADTTYSYRVRAVDAAGNTGPFSDTAEATTPPAADTEPPSAPSGLSAKAVSPGEVDLSWGAATDASSVIYDVQRCTGSGCTDFASLATAAATSYADTSTAADTTYSYRVRAVDAAGNTGPFSDTAEATTPPLSSPGGPGPLTVAPSGRYLLDQNGKPFLLTGDSPQALIGNLTESDADVYFASRRAEGFNTVWINLLCNSYTGCRDDGSTWDGVPPFTTPGDFSTPNEAYFARVDNIIRLAGQYGLVVLLDPSETGGWLGTMEANGVDKLRAYGQYLGTRYRDFPNIIWMHGNDFQNWGPDTDPYVTAVALGISDTDTRHLQTVELDYPTSGSLDDPAWAPLIQLNASYTYDPTYMQVLTDYNRTNFLPTFMVEANYEFEQNVGPPGGTPLQLRRQEYWTMLSGATGQLYGNHYTWQFICPQRDGSGNCIGGWKDELDTPGQTQFGYVKQLFEPRRWYDLVPDQNHAVVTAGFGTYGTDDYATAASTSDGKLAIVYMPSSRTITVDLSKFAGTVSARWYDPGAGTFATDSGSPYANSGSQEFAPPGPNAAGDGDWVLVLEASSP